MDGATDEEFHLCRAQLGRSLTSAEQLCQQLDLLGGCLENRWQEDAGVSVEGITVPPLPFVARFVHQRWKIGGRAAETDASLPWRPGRFAALFFRLFTQSERLQIKIDALELKTSSSNLELNFGARKSILTGEGMKKSTKLNISNILESALLRLFTPSGKTAQRPRTPPPKSEVTRRKTDNIRYMKLNQVTRRKRKR